MLTLTPLLKRLTPPLTAMLVFGFAADASPARAIVWEKRSTKTVIIKSPAREVKVRYVRPHRGRVKRETGRKTAALNAG